MEMTDVYWLLMSYYLNLAASDEEWIQSRRTRMEAGPGKGEEEKAHWGGGGGGRGGGGGGRGGERRMH